MGNAIRDFVLRDPMLSSDAIAEKLEELGIEVPPNAYNRHVRNSPKDMTWFLRWEALLEDKPNELPVSMGGPRECLQEPDNTSRTDEAKPEI